MASPEVLETEVHASLNRVRGRLAGLIESVGLPEKQERSLISIMKSLTYDVEAELIDLIQD